MILGRLLKRSFQIRFKDRTSAGQILGDFLADSFKKEHEKTGIVVLAIPRGGVIIGDKIASKFKQSEFDIVIPRKLGAPDNPELAIGATMEDRTVIRNEQAIKNLQVSDQYFDDEIDRQVIEIKRRITMYRPASKPYNLAGKSVVVVDDGIATGATVMVVVKWIKKYHPDSVLVAVPVAPEDTISELSREGIQIKVISTPLSFASVSQFYEHFSQVTDDEVREVARKWGLL